ncbi:MAG: glycosyltransferase family 4 protein [Planctomycetota bacterium]
MKILVVAASYPPEIGGIAAHVYFLCRGLARRGHDVTAAIAMRRLEGPPSIEADGDVEVHRVPGIVRLGPITYSAGTSRLRACVSALVGGREFDVCHIHGHAYEAHATRGLDASLPRIGTMHSSIYLSKAATARGQRKLKKALRGLVSITAPSTEICEVTDRLGLPAGKCVFIPNGVDTEVFRPGVNGSALAREYGFPQGRKVVLCARRIAPKNGVLHFAKSLGNILAAHPDAVVAFAGSEDEGYCDLVRAAAAENTPDGSVFFLGSVPNDRMPELMAAASVSVLPSLVEATSITGLESMASGLPLVGTTVGGIPELIDDGVQGLLVPPADPDALADAVSRLLADDGFARRLGSAARERAVAEFDWDRIASRFEDVYRDAIRRSSGEGAGSPA